MINVGGITTTEVCNISCVMCHFNGPKAVRKAGTLDPEEVRLFLRQLPPGQHVPFAATGEFFMDPHAMDHLRAAVELGHQPSILTNGLLFSAKLIDEILELGIRLVSFSVDAIDNDQYRRIRRGGEFRLILEASDYFRRRKADYPDLRVEVNNTLFKTTFPRQQEYIDFWRGKVDQVNFNAEYYDTFKFRNLLSEPGERVDCQIRTFLVPNGKITPCCAMTVYQHEHETPWLPNIRDMSLAEAQVYLQGLYDNHDSPLGRLCQGCDWWILFKPDQNGNTPYMRFVPLDHHEQPEDVRRRSRELAGAGGLAQALLRTLGRLR